MASHDLSLSVFAACENTKHNSQAAAVKAVQRLVPDAQPYDIKQVLSHHVLDRQWIEAKVHRRVLIEGCNVTLSDIGLLTAEGQRAFERLSGNQAKP